MFYMNHNTGIAPLPTKALDQLLLIPVNASIHPLHANSYNRYSVSMQCDVNEHARKSHESHPWTDNFTVNQ